MHRWSSAARWRAATGGPACRAQRGAAVGQRMSKRLGVQRCGAHPGRLGGPPPGARPSSRLRFIAKQPGRSGARFGAIRADVDRREGSTCLRPAGVHSGGGARVSRTFYFPPLRPRPLRRERQRVPREPAATPGGRHSPAQPVSALRAGAAPSGHGGRRPATPGRRRAACGRRLRVRSARAALHRNCCCVALPCAAVRRPSCVLTLRPWRTAPLRWCLRPRA